MDDNDKDLDMLMFLSLLDEEEEINRKTYSTPSQGVSPFVNFIAIGLLIFGVLLIVAMIAG